MMRLFLLMVVFLGLACSSSVLKKLAMSEYDTTRLMRATANSLARVSPAPSWRIDAEHTDVSETHLLGKGIVLLGLEAAKIPWNLAGSFVAVDTKTGRKLWDYDASGYEWLEVAAIPAGELVIIRRQQSKKTEYIGLAVHNGKLLWKVSQKDVHLFTVDKDRKQVLFAIHGDKTRIVARSLKKGDKLWSASLTGSVQHLISTPAGLLAVGQHVTALDPHSGAKKWTTDLPAKLASSSAPVWGPEGLLVPLQNERVILLSRSGKQKLAIKQKGEPRTLLSSSNLLVAEFSKALVGVSPSGGSRWVKPLSRPLSSVLERKGKRLAFTVGAEVFLLNALNGKEVCSWKDWDATSRTLPHTIRIEDDQLVLASEQAIAAYPLNCGPALWQHRLSEGLTWGPVSKELKYAVNQKAKMQGASKKTKQDINNYLTFSEIGQTAPTSLVQAQHQSYMARTQRKLESNISSGERRLIHQGRQNSISISSANLQAQRSIELSMLVVDFQLSSINFMLDLGNKIESIKAENQAEAVRARVRRLRDRKAVVERAHYGSIQGKWFIRPFKWMDGQGLFVVDTSNGSWREIVTSPKESVLNRFLLNVPLGLVDDAGRLVSYGIGLDTANWKKWDDLQAEFTTYHRSFLAYDLNGIKWRKAGSYPKMSFASIAAKAP